MTPTLRFESGDFQSATVGRRSAPVRFLELRAELNADGRVPLTTSFFLKPRTIMVEDFESRTMLREPPLIVRFWEKTKPQNLVVKLTPAAQARLEVWFDEWEERGFAPQGMLGGVLSGGV